MKNKIHPIIRNRKKSGTNGVAPKTRECPVKPETPIKVYAARFNHYYKYVVVK